MQKPELITVETALQTDVDQIIQIAEESKLAHWSKEDYTCEITRKNSFVAVYRIDELAAGFIASRFNAQTFNKQNVSFDHLEADLLNIGVMKKFRNRGIGQRLLDELLAKAEKLQVKTVWLEVRASNFNAQTFYKRNGFTEIQRRRNFYTFPTEDAVLMKLELSNIKQIKKGNIKT